MIEGVVVKPLKIFEDSRGKVMHMLRSDDDMFKGFGEVYFSVINPGVIKGWKKHRKMTQHFVVPVGKLKVVLFDDREDVSTRGEVEEVHIGGESYSLLCIPPGVWYSFKSDLDEYALIANCTDIPHDPEEVVNTDCFDKKIPYKWEKIDAK